MVANFKVFKKTAPNGKLTLYLGKRDFVDHVSAVEPIGIVCLYYSLPSHSVRKVLAIMSKFSISKFSMGKICFLQSLGVR